VGLCGWHEVQNAPPSSAELRMLAYDTCTQERYNTISLIPKTNILNKIPPDITKLLISSRIITRLIFTQIKHPLAGGKFCNRSTEFLVCVGNRISRFDVILSHIINRNIITLTNEIVDPIDEIMFHMFLLHAQG